MAVPKRKRSQSRVKRTRANIYVKHPALVKCPKCGKPVLPHTICGFCGFYKGKEYINVMAKLEKKEQKKRKEEIKESETTTKKEEKKK
jgi:large subunit ribosomal protein L32